MAGTGLWGETFVDVVGYSHRIKCSEHNIVVADFPYSYPESKFTKEFDITVDWLAVYLPHSVVLEYTRID